MDIDLLHVSGYLSCYVQLFCLCAHVLEALGYRLTYLGAMSEGGEKAETDKNIEIWKIKKLIKGLESARGNGTSMISLIMPPR